MTLQPGQSLKSSLKSRAHELGFQTVRITSPEPTGQMGERLRDFLANGRHGDMDWMERNADRRSDPKALWPGVQSVIMLGMSYAPHDDPLANLSQLSRGTISVYARGKDYHGILKRKLTILAREFQQMSGADVKIFVDTAPLMEKPLAAAAGMGWQGKHTNLVSREHGSWLFLGAILTAASIEPDKAEVDHCGRCQRCLDVCPTRAFPAPYVLDARRCIAYLTIEHKGHIPREFRSAMGNRIFGCDDCLAVCPWNKFARQSSEQHFATQSATDNPPLEELLTLDDASFRKRFAGTPVKRTGRDRFVRNVLIAAGNSENSSLVPMVKCLLGDDSPLVRAMAVWVCGRLLPSEEFVRERSRWMPLERDREVGAEWEHEGSR